MALRRRDGEKMRGGREGERRRENKGEEEKGGREVERRREIKGTRERRKEEEGKEREDVRIRERGRKKKRRYIFFPKRYRRHLPTDEPPDLFLPYPTLASA